MKPFDLDKASRLLAARHSRRTTLAGGAAALAAGVLASGRASAQEATPEAAAPELLFVQLFSTGDLAPGEVGDGTFILTLSGGTGSTIYFTDRPNRMVGTIPTDQFLDELGAAADDPPNAALLAEGIAEDLVLIVELLSAKIDDDAGTISYVVRFLTEDETDMQFDSPLSLPPTAGLPLMNCHLFIDDMTMGCSPWDPRC